MAKTNTGLVAYAKAQLGRPYWYGTFGHIGTEALYNEKKERYPQYYDRSKYTQGWTHQYGQKVHDCVGLIKGYLFSDNNNSAYNPKLYKRAWDISANKMYSVCKEKGSIATIPEIPGVLVFSPGHVGVYIGNGEVIEARGHSYGVVQTRLDARPWVNWGKCPYITYNSSIAIPATNSATSSKAVKYTVVCSSLRVRKGPGLTYGTTRYLTKGITVIVAETKGTWGKLGEGQWISIKPAFVKKV